MRHLLLLLILLISRPILGCDPDSIQSNRPGNRGVPRSVGHLPRQPRSRVAR